MEIYFLVLSAIANYIFPDHPVTKLKHQRQEGHKSNNKCIQNRNDIEILLIKHVENVQFPITIIAHKRV